VYIIASVLIVPVDNSTLGAMRSGQKIFIDQRRKKIFFFSVEAEGNDEERTGIHRVKIPRINFQ